MREPRVPCAYPPGPARWPDRCTGDQMRLLLIGAPGAGKGTQAERLAKHFGIAHISSGDLLRQHVRDRTSLGQTAKSYVDKGRPGS